DLDFKQPVFALVDRIAVDAGVRARIVDALEICYRESGEAIFQSVPREGEQPISLRFSRRFECKHCRRRYDEPEPRMFSFNNPFGACPRCQGFGNTIDFDLNLVIPDPQKTLGEGAIDPWSKPKYRQLAAELKRYCRGRDIPTDVPWRELTPEQQKLVLEGERGAFLGVRGFFAHLERKKYKLHVRVFLSRYRGYSVCGDCRGARLRSQAQLIRIGGEGATRGPGLGPAGSRNICEVCAMTVEEAARFVATLKLTDQQRAIAEKILDEIRDRLRFLMEV